MKWENFLQVYGGHEDDILTHQHYLQGGDDWAHKYYDSINNYMIEKRINSYYDILQKIWRENKNDERIAELREAYKKEKKLFFILPSAKEDFKRRIITRYAKKLLVENDEYDKRQAALKRQAKIDLMTPEERDLFFKEEERKKREQKERDEWLMNSPYARNGPIGYM